jgi:hypothetical protein
MTKGQPIRLVFFLPVPQLSTNKNKALTGRKGLFLLKHGKQTVNKKHGVTGNKTRHMINRECSGMQASGLPAG